MICSSVNRLGFMSIPSEVMDSTHFWRRFWGSGQWRELPRLRGPNPHQARHFSDMPTALSDVRFQVNGHSRDRRACLKGAHNRTYKAKLHLRAAL
jgi:hypothetical protein